MCYPDEMAKVLCVIAYDDPEKDVIDDCTYALSNLKAIAENKYNSDFYRTMWNVLQRIVYNNQWKEKYDY